MTQQVRVDHTVDDIEALVSEAIRFGYMRVEPRKSWTMAEKKDAARYAIRSIVDLHFECKIEG